MVQGPSASESPGSLFKTHTSPRPSPFELGSGRAHAAACDQIPSFSPCTEFEDLGSRSPAGREHRLGHPHCLSVWGRGLACRLWGTLAPLGVTFLLLLFILKPGPQSRCDTGEALVCEGQGRRLIGQGRGRGWGRSAPGQIHVGHVLGQCPACCSGPSALHAAPWPRFSHCRPRSSGGESQRGTFIL